MRPIRQWTRFVPGDWRVPNNTIQRTCSPRPHSEFRHHRPYVWISHSLPLLYQHRTNEPILGSSSKYCYSASPSPITFHCCGIGPPGPRRPRCLSQLRPTPMHGRVDIFRYPHHRHGIWRFCCWLMPTPYCRPFKHGRGLQSHQHQNTTFSGPIPYHAIHVGSLQQARTCHLLFKG